jgi:hypothetical protein
MAYTGKILKDPSDLEGVRLLAHMNATRLSDAAILSPAFLPAVEAKLILKVPTYAGLSGNDLAFLRSAATKLTAALAVRMIPDSEKSLDYTYTQDCKARADALEAEAAADITNIAAVSAALEEPDIASVEGPTRERKKTGGGWIEAGTVIS